MMQYIALAIYRDKKRSSLITMTATFLKFKLVAYVAGFLLYSGFSENRELNRSSSSRFLLSFVGGSRASSRYIPWYTRLQNGLIGQKAFSGRLNPLRTFCAFFKTFYPVTSDLWGKEVFCLDLACVARQQDGAPSLYSSPVPFPDLLSPSLLLALNSLSTSPNS